MNQSNITKSIKHKIENIDYQSTPQSAGIIKEVGDGIAIVDGLNDAFANEIIEFPGGVRGVALNLNLDTVGVVILGDDQKLRQGDVARSTGQQLAIGAADALLGRVINSLGDPLDGGEPIKADEMMPLERVAPGVIAREPVSQPLQTGIKAIDSMIPIGRGQRELIIGDRSTGKSSVALGTIINQLDENVISIYVSIGQKRAFIAQTIGTLNKHDVMKNTIIVAASASEPAAMQYLAPYAGVAIAEYFAAKGKDVLIVYDDLTKHAWAYREVSLLLRRPSGREAYPGDVFYLHSRLLERAVKLNKKQGGGSITALPIIETQAGDVSAYIPTNVISITDGQIFLDADMFNSGQRPAVDLGISVSRVGGAAQIKAMKQVVGSLKIDMAQYRELAAFAQFSSDLDAQTKAQLERGQRITEILKQNWENPMSVIDQVMVFWAIKNGYLDSVIIDQVKEWELAFATHLKEKHAALVKTVAKEQKISEAIEAELHQILKTFNQSHPELMIVED
jgi:F-type H+/Na+-transporting ATPase subunit alpha